MKTLNAIGRFLTQYPILTFAFGLILQAVFMLTTTIDPASPNLPWQQSNWALMFVFITVAVLVAEKDNLQFVALMLGMAVQPALSAGYLTVPAIQFGWQQQLVVFLAASLGFLVFCLIGSRVFATKKVASVRK